MFRLGANPSGVDKQELLDGFEAGPVDLNKHGARDSIVTNSVLNGANTGPFWVVIKTAQGYKLALFVTSHDLTLLRTKTRGYRDISTGTANATTLAGEVYKFNRKKYR